MEFIYFLKISSVFEITTDPFDPFFVPGVLDVPGVQLVFRERYLGGGG